MTIKISDKRIIDRPLAPFVEAEKAADTVLSLKYALEIYPETLARCQAQVIANQTRALIAAGRQAEAQKS